MITVDVEVPSASYPVVVGAGARRMLDELLPAGTERVALVSQVGVPTVEVGVESRNFLIGTREIEKSMATVERLCRGFARWGITRGDCVVAVGGGLVTDVAGFAASVFHRGVPVIHVATTLLAQIDAAIGGKCGVNLPEGKNLVGSFWQPHAVICDTELLATLPERELRSGYGEMAKYHFLTGEDLSDLPLDERIARCVAIKAAVVAADEREQTGARAVLNYGHTLAHALETAGHYDLLHGEAVGVGLVYAAELARRLGRISDERAEQHRAVVHGYGLPTRMPPGVDRNLLVALFARDKKAVGGITFVLDGPDGIEAVRGVPREVIDGAFEAVS